MIVTRSTQLIFFSFLCCDLSMIHATCNTEANNKKYVGYVFEIQKHKKVDCVIIRQTESLEYLGDDLVSSKVAQN